MNPRHRQERPEEVNYHKERRDKLSQRKENEKERV